MPLSLITPAYAAELMPDDTMPYADDYFAATLMRLLLRCAYARVCAA